MRHLVLAAAMAFAPVAVLADAAHKIAVHVNNGDPKVLNMALNNVQNVKAYYDAKGEEVEIELVAYGPGLVMFIDGKSPVADRVKTMSLENEHLSFSACGNTLQKMSKKLGKDVPLMSEASVVPSGVVRLIELQESGYSYVRP
ncbi:DsrE family protein [Thalassovita aquimarina]|nr:DsrE family protein [Thalassovita aquimarina]